MQPKIALIIGAGPAGLTAAYELLTRTNIKPIIVEAESQVGGLSKTIDYKGNKIDIGGHRFFSKSQEVVNWWFKFLPLDPSFNQSQLRIQYQNKSATISPNTESVSSDRKTYMLVRPRKSRIYHNKKFFDYPLQLNVDTLRKLGLPKLMRIAASYSKAKLFPEKPEANLAVFFRNRFGKELYHTFFKDYTEKVWGIPCEQIPADWGRQRIKDLNVAEVLLHSIKSIFKSNKDIRQKDTSTSLIEQFLYPPLGPGQMWETVANEIERLGGQILLNTKLISLQADADRTIQSCTIQNCKSGETRNLNAEFFFSSMPVKELVAAIKGIDIPDSVRAIAQGLPYRDFLIVGILAKKIGNDSLKENELTDNWIYIQDKNVRAGRVQFFHNWSPYMIADPKNAWIGVEYFCDETDAFWNLSDDELIQYAVREMDSIDLVKKENLLDAVVIKVKKAYPSYHGTYNRFGELRTFLDTFGNLFEVGRNGMHRYNNSDHSMLTAIRAVDAIVAKSDDRTNIWEVNTEEDYHEQ